MSKRRVGYRRRMARGDAERLLPIAPP